MRPAARSLAVRGFSVWCAVVACSPSRPPPPAPVVAPPPLVAPAEPSPPAAPLRPRPDLPALPSTGDSDVSAWQARHTAQLEAPGRAASQLVVLGDSVAEALCASRPFQKQWGRHKPLNLGLSGDHAAQVLWRIDHGALGGLAPRLTLIALGQDGLDAGLTGEETARGVRAVLAAVRRALPGSKVLLLGLLPVGQNPDDPRRAQAQAANGELARLAEPERVVIADIGSMLLDADGSLSPHVMSDSRHPTAAAHDAIVTSISLVTENLLRR